MAKKGRKNISGQKKVPRVEQIRQKEKRSRRNSWITSLVAIGLVALLSIFWYISSNSSSSGGRFQSKYDAFSIDLPDSWTSYNLEETLKFDGALGNSSHPHLFAPKSVDIGIDDTGSVSNVPTLEVDQEFLEALEKNQGGKASDEINKQLTEKLQEQVGEQKIGKPEVDLTLTVLSAAIFTDEKSDEDIRRYISGIGGIDEPVEFYLTKLELEGTKIPGASYGYYKLLGGHPTGIIKTDDYTVIFNGIFAEKYEGDFKSIFESIETP